MEDYMPSSEFNSIKSQETEDEMLSLFPLNKSGETIKANSFDDISFQNMMNRAPMMEDNVNNLINTNELNQINNISELTKMDDVSLMNQLDHHKANHTHNHYIDNPFYYETTNMPALNSKVKPSFCCYCGNNQNSKLNHQLENHQNQNINNTDNILMKTSQYTPQSIPIPNMSNVSTNYSSFDGIDNIEKTLEEVKELIEKSKALSLGEIISPSNHSSELNEKIMNSPKTESESESIDENNNKENIENTNKSIIVIEKQDNSKEESKSNENSNGNTFVKTTTLLTETITTTTTTTIKQLTKIEIEDSSIINEKQEVKEQTFTDKETKVEVINTNSNNESEFDKSPKSEESTEKKEELVKVYEEDKKDEDEEDESLYSSPDRANDSGFVSDDSTSCYSSRSSSPSGRRRRKSSLKSPNFPGHRKSVQFSNDLEMVCLFECLDKPEDIGESPQFVVPDSKDMTTETPEKEPEEIIYKNGICLINIPVFTPFDMMSNVMGLESIELVDGSILKGTIQVKNLAYHKLVFIRYTLDNWNTSKETPAVYTSAVTNGTAFYSDVGLDLFTFTIDMTSQFNAFNNSLVPHFADHPINMSFAIRYEVNHCTYWDNNNNNNFQLEFVQLPLSEPSVTRKKCYRSPGHKALMEMANQKDKDNNAHLTNNTNDYKFSSAAVCTIPAAKFAAMKKKRRQLASHPPVVVPVYPPPPSSDYLSSNNTMFNASSYLIQQQQSAAYSSIYNADTRGGRYGPSPYTIYK